VKCENCGVEFESERRTARFCSMRCKSSHHRLSVSEVGGISVSEVSVSPLSVSGVSIDVPCEVLRKGVGIRLDLEKDLKLNLRKDLGVSSWTENGIMVLPEITVEQVRNIARLVHARNGRVCPTFNECI
jgi:hypothetical protein